MGQARDGDHHEDDYDAEHNAAEEFYWSRLTARSWAVRLGGQVNNFNDPPALLGAIPKLTRYMEPAVHAADMLVSGLGAKVTGRLTFKYMEGPKRGETFNCCTPCFS